jgi:FtsZ-interacting cell division protein ZipA
VHLDARGGIHLGEAEHSRPDMRGERRADPRDRDPMADLPVVEMDDAELSGLRVDDETAVDEFSTARADEQTTSHVAPMIPELAPPAGAEEAFSAVENEPEVDDVEPMSSDEGSSDGALSDDNPVAAASIPPVEPVAEPIVDWPEEDTRKIIAFRLVSGAGDRFQGRTVRLALAAEGFQLGKFEIFHKPGPDSRAVLSAASLTKPGTFSLATMDSQRFGGLSLFAVLPGPLSPAATFDELLLTARGLNDRLRGALQDERGEPLTPMRSATIRESLTAAATAAAPVVGPAPTAPAMGPADTPH